MLKEFKIGKKYRVLTLNELVKKYNNDIINIDSNRAKGIKIPSDSTIYNIQMENLNTRRFVADKQYIHLLVGGVSYNIKPWMCEEVETEGFELPQGLKYVFNSNTFLKTVDLIIDGAVKYERIKCNILDGKSLQLILNFNTENKCIVTFDIMQFVKGEMVVRDSESKMIICPYEIVPSKISLSDILTCKIQNYPLIGKVTEVNGSPQGILTVIVLDVPIESGMLGVECYVSIEDFERGNVKKLVIEWD